MYLYIHVHLLSVVMHAHCPYKHMSSLAEPWAVVCHVSSLRHSSGLVFACTPRPLPPPPVVFRWWSGSLFSSAHKVMFCAISQFHPCHSSNDQQSGILMRSVHSCEQCCHVGLWRRCSLYFPCVSALVPAPTSSAWRACGLHAREMHQIPEISGNLLPGWCTCNLTAFVCSAEQAAQVVT